MATDFEDVGGGVQLFFGETAAAVRVPVRVDANGQILTAGGSSGTADLGNVGSYGTTILQTPTITSGTAYVAGDGVGGLLTFASAARNSGGGGVVSSVTWIDNAGQDAELELWLFNQSIASGTVDADPWACGTADLQNIVGVISTEDSDQGWLAAGTPSVCTVNGAMLRYDCDATSLFGRMVSPTDTPTYTSTTSLTVKVGMLQD